MNFKHQHSIRLLKERQQQLLQKLTGGDLDDNMIIQCSMNFADISAAIVVLEETAQGLRDRNTQFLEMKNEKSND